MSDRSDKTLPKGTLNTFSGVFTPSILTILGIILFLRLGYVVGSAGLMQALVIIAIANVISVLTSFSLAAIATNIKVKGGGDYYLISRTLGPEFGGALGLVLFLAQSVSIAFYCIGFGEALSSIMSNSGSFMTPQIIAAVAVAFLFVLAWVGADLATKFQYVVMAFLTIALISFYIGGFSNWNTSLIGANWTKPLGGPGFWVIFAIFFPAVTGFTQGVSMSGDLKDPGKSLPTGTFLAVAISIVIYFSVAVIFAATSTTEILSVDYSAMNKISRWGFFIDAGVIAATLSSAMASFLGAPRILQSLAGDRIFSFLIPFAKGFGPSQNPRRGVLLSGLIAIITIALGQLDLIARLVSMFFLISYGLLNYATFFEAKAASPSFRPRFRWYHPVLSLMGFVTCLGVMLAIDLKMGIVAIAILFAIYQYLQRTAGPSRWADSQRSHHLQRVRENLMAAGSDPDHPRDWRPYILALSDDQERRKNLLEFASLIEGGSGITTVARFLQGSGPRMRKERKAAADALKKEILQHRKDAFSLVVSGPEPQTALETTIQSFGLGTIHANTVLLNWMKENTPQDEPNSHIRNRQTIRYGESLRTAFRMGCHIVILHAPAEKWNSLSEIDPEKHSIDVWWQGDDTSRLMLLLAFMVTKNQQWSEAIIRVFAINYDDDSAENMAELQKMLEDARIEADANIVLNDKKEKNDGSRNSNDTEENTNENIFAELSNDSSLTFLPFTIKNSIPVDIYGNPVEHLLPKLGVTALVMAGQDVALDAEPEEGDAAIIAQALDALEMANQRASRAEKEAFKAAEIATEKMQEIELSGGRFDEKMIAKLQAALKARQNADIAAKKALKEQAKSSDAAKEAEALGAAPVKTIPGKES
ncbi:Amino acid permease-associated region [Desulfamplus magnetovallimortis]|uniref:Amino acid permease-associated region n=1 Tax=Desulfamplus magnetovallimortis TaxID=1246637 RepID=A0A1W1HHQ6_9BACT|nr:amino acid permease [Desulfamplus magnetovallimortis]SLM31955.1 Amino acid permease-associated region [Desulfamplus magnetovallimortis]